MSVVKNIQIHFTAYYGSVSVDIMLGETNYKMDISHLVDFIESKISLGEVKYTDGKGNLKPRIALV